MFPTCITWSLFWLLYPGNVHLHTYLTRMDKLCINEGFQRFTWPDLILCFIYSGIHLNAVVSWWQVSWIFLKSVQGCLEMQICWGHARDLWMKFEPVQSHRIGVRAWVVWPPIILDYHDKGFTAPSNNEGALVRISWLSLAYCRALIILDNLFHSTYNRITD